MRSDGAPADLTAEQIGAAYLGGHVSLSDLPGPPAEARQQQGVSLAGVDVRRLERLAAARGVPVDTLAQELLEEALRGSAS